jgi:uncharacterized protein (DUF305 family)
MRRFCLLPVLILACVAAPALATASDTAFIAQIDAAMTKMMIGMNIRPSGDVDRDFVDIMAAHHDGAIQMSEAELQYGHDEQLRRIAQEIIITQQQEIAAMKDAIGEPLPQPVPAQTPGE